MCKALENEEDSTIEHYINIGDVNSLLDPHMASVGLSDPKILASESSVRCSFRRANKQPQIRNYVTFEPDTRFYMIAVFGQVTVNRNKKNNKPLQYNTNTTQFKALDSELN